MLPSGLAGEIRMKRDGKGIRQYAADFCEIRDMLMINRRYLRETLPGCGHGIQNSGPRNTRYFSKSEYRFLAQAGQLDQIQDRGRRQHDGLHCHQAPSWRRSWSAGPSRRSSWLTNGGTG